MARRPRASSGLPLARAAQGRRLSLPWAAHAPPSPTLQWTASVLGIGSAERHAEGPPGATAAVVANAHAHVRRSATGTIPDAFATLDAAFAEAHATVRALRLPPMSMILCAPVAGGLAPAGTLTFAHTGACQARRLTEGGAGWERLTVSHDVTDAPCEVARVLRARPGMLRASADGSTLVDVVDGTQVRCTRGLGTRRAGVLAHPSLRALPGSTADVVVIAETSAWNSWLGSATVAADLRALADAPASSAEQLAAALGCMGALAGRPTNHGVLVWR
jgi:hypothetical protein